MTKVLTTEELLQVMRAKGMDEPWATITEKNRWGITHLLTYRKAKNAATTIWGYEFKNNKLAAKVNYRELKAAEKRDFVMMITGGQQQIEFNN